MTNQKLTAGKVIARQSAVVALLFLACAAAFSQTTSGNIVGTVFDPTRAVVPNAQVTAVNTETGAQTTTTTSSTGEYRMSNLPVGMYNITVEATGFVKMELAKVSVELNATITANATLGLAQATTSVEVSTTAVAIDTTTAQIQSTFEAKEMTDLPSASTGSGVINLSLLDAGVATSGGVGVGTGPSVGGQRPRNNNFTIEGIDNNSGSVTGPLVQVPNDAVAEFSVVQNQFSPDFGHSSGGQFNQVVRSGTNEFHGEAYEYFENRNLNAADNLSAVDGTPLHPRFDDNRFGGNVGGPILRNKLFFFADYERNPIGEAGSAGLLYAPTQAGYNTLASIPGINQTNLSVLKQYLGVAPTAVSTSVFGPYPTVGPGNEAAGMQAANAQSIQVGQLSIPTPSYSNSEAGVASVDYNISDKDSLRGRFILNRSASIDTAASLPVFFTNTPTNDYLATFSEYHNFTATLNNEFRFGYNRNSSQDPVGTQKFPGLDQFPNIDIFELNLQMGPDPNAPQFGYQNTYQLTDNVSLTKGAHNLKFGFDGMRNISPQSFTQRSRGDYEYSYLSDYLFDYYPDYLAQRSQGDPIYWGNRWLLGSYGNDSWKVNPHLTVNLGLRYEYQTVPAGEQEQVLNAAASVPGLINFGKPTAQTNALMPRVGFAYSPGTDGRTSFRGGFGINYDVLYDNQGLLTLPPELSTTIDVTGEPGQGFLANGGIPPTGPSASFTPAEAIAATSGFVPNQKRPKALQWNFGIQHEFGSNYVLDVRYLGTRGINLPVQIQLDKQPVVDASNALPVYFTAPSQATLNSLTNTLSSLTAAYDAGGDIVPSYYAAGFRNTITSYQPWGNSTYHGLATTLNRRFSSGLQMQGAYTWSHDIDDSTADVFSTYLTPRRAQNSQDLEADRASSALDHRQRFSLETLYDLPFFKHSNWFMKNLVGNWEFAPIYQYQTGTLYTIQSGVDANLNGDSAPDRVFYNPAGNPNIGTSVTPLQNIAGQTVAYVANNPDAGYVAAAKGTLPTVGRNTGQLNPIDDIDLTLAKRFTITERFRLEFSARAFNVFNHPQYVAGNISDVAPIGFTSSDVHSFLIPGTSLFDQASQVFSSNPRSMQLALKLVF